MGGSRGEKPGSPNRRLVRKCAVIFPWGGPASAEEIAAVFAFLASGPHYGQTILRQLA